jgi:putative polyketide hydroxylase
MEAEHTQVLIIGAGGAGLSLSLLLLQQGIRPLIVERRDNISWYPRARNLNFRTLEVFRGLGLATRIHDAGAHVSRISARQQLASPEQRLVMDPATLLDTSALQSGAILMVLPAEPIGTHSSGRSATGWL